MLFDELAAENGRKARLASQMYSKLQVLKVELAPEPEDVPFAMEVSQYMTGDGSSSKHLLTELGIGYRFRP